MIGQISSLSRFLLGEFYFHYNIFLLVVLLTSFS